ncbi:urotensin II-related peptide [Clarias gariepinus]|uniref:urotensin II-related peptide n=1 Tax=Clarias gariepinus TaxID=13013 RepID=UPI00234DA305|nr:urotensin II-related peptide [Clarias gariepinus]
MDAAPITSEVSDLQQTSVKGDQKTDPWKSGPDIHDTTRYFDGQEMTTPVRPSGSLDKAISSPHYLDKLLAAADTQSQTLMVPSRPVDSDGLENIISAVKRLDVQLKQDSMMDDPDREEHAPMEESSVHKPVKQILVAVNSNKQRKTLLETKGAKVNSTPDRREKILHMLSALEKLHRSLNRTLNSRVTIITRGNSNSRSPGKKNKMITDGNMKSTTASNVISKGASPRSSTDQMDPKLLSGKAFKKSLPSTPKKTNKRVCFWKYCSQN